MRRISYSTEQKIVFRDTFGVDLHTYWSPFTGFDLVKFDDEVIKSGDGQMKAAVRKQYGDEAVRLITRLTFA